MYCRCLSSTDIRAEVADVVQRSYEFSSLAALLALISTFQKRFALATLSTKRCDVRHFCVPFSSSLVKATLTLSA